MPASIGGKGKSGTGKNCKWLFEKNQVKNEKYKGRKRKCLIGYKETSSPHCNYTVENNSKSPQLSVSGSVYMYQQLENWWDVWMCNSEARDYSGLYTENSLIIVWTYQPFLELGSTKKNSENTKKKLGSTKKKLGKHNAKKKSGNTTRNFGKHRKKSGSIKKNRQAQRRYWEAQRRNLEAQRGNGQAQRRNVKHIEVLSYMSSQFS